MRTFVTWRFWLTMVALAGLTYGLLQLTKDEAVAQPAHDTPASTPANGAATSTTVTDTGTAGQGVGAPAEHDIDLIAPVFLVQADSGTSFADGRTSGRLQVRIDGFRYMNIPSGTPGENRCRELTTLASCVVAADLLGETVLWFSFLPAEPRSLVTLPSIVELRDGGLALLANGWIVHRAELVTRDCDDDVPSLSAFIDIYGPSATSTFDLDRQLLTSVTCTVAEPVGTAPPATVLVTNR